MGLLFPGTAGRKVKQDQEEISRNHVPETHLRNLRNLISGIRPAVHCSVVHGGNLERYLATLTSHRFSVDNPLLLVFSVLD